MEVARRTSSSGIFSPPARGFPRAVYTMASDDTRNKETATPEAVRTVRRLLRSKLCRIKRHIFFNRFYPIDGGAWGMLVRVARNAPSSCDMARAARPGISPHVAQCHRDVRLGGAVSGQERSEQGNPQRQGKAHDEGLGP